MSAELPEIAVVDRSAVMRSMFEACLEKMEVKLRFFDSLVAASEYLDQNRPVLLFLSNKVQGKDGLSFLRELRRRSQNQDIAVVLISSKNYMQDRIVAEELGVIEFMVKPMPMQAIRDIVAKNLPDNKQS